MTRDERELLTIILELMTSRPPSEPVGYFDVSYVEGRCKSDAINAAWALDQDPNLWQSKIILLNQRAWLEFFSKHHANKLVRAECRAALGKLTLTNRQMELH